MDMAVVGSSVAFSPFIPSLERLCFSSSRDTVLPSPFSLPSESSSDDDAVPLIELLNSVRLLIRRGRPMVEIKKGTHRQPRIPILAPVRAPCLSSFFLCCNDANLTKSELAALRSSRTEARCTVSISELFHRLLSLLEPPQLGSCCYYRCLGRSVYCLLMGRQTVIEAV